MTENIRVLVVDDQSRARRSMQALLATWPDVAELREAVNGREAVSFVEDFQPNLVLMDAQMPEMGGIEATRLIKAQHPEIKIMVLSMYSDYEPAALDAGADAFVSKGESPEKLLATLSTLLSQTPKRD